DGHGGSTSSTLTIRIDGCADNRPPVAYADTISIKEDTSPNPVTGNVLPNDSDPDGNILSVTNAGTFTLDHGLLVIHADGTYTYTLDNNNLAVNALNDGQTLTDSFTYNISDGHGGTASAYLNVTINGTTDAPTCGCHCSSTPPGGTPTDTSTHVTPGTWHGDTISGLDDTINTIYALGGNDIVTGGDDAINTIYAGAGNDTVTGGNNATNTIYAESGQDLIKGGFHSINDLYGASGQNHLIGGDCSVNNIFGGAGDATIDGGNMNSINTMYAGGGAVTMHGGNDSTNTMYAEWGNGVVVTGGNNAENTFFDGGGNATYIGGQGDNLFVFNDLKYPTLSQGIQGNQVYPVALTNQDVTSHFEYVSNGTDTVHGNASSTENVIGLIGRADIQTWTINLTNPTDASHATDGSWVAHAGHTLSGTITNNVNGAVVTFDTINKVTFLG
ncbi:MAG: Ig-like domain-containing protein, partial [Candidatus Paracaedibacter sp.]